MKNLLKFFKWLAIALMSIVLLMYVFDVDYLLRAVKTVYFKGHTTAYLEDYKEFPNREIKKGTAQPWNLTTDYNQIPSTPLLNKTHKELQTVCANVDSILETEREAQHEQQQSRKNEHFL